MEDYANETMDSFRGDGSVLLEGSDTLYKHVNTPGDRAVMTAHPPPRPSQVMSQDSDPLVGVTDICQTLAVVALGTDFTNFLTCQNTYSLIY